MEGEPQRNTRRRGSILKGVEGCLVFSKTTRATESGEFVKHTQTTNSRDLVRVPVSLSLYFLICKLETTVLASQYCSEDLTCLKRGPTVDSDTACKLAFRNPLLQEKQIFTWTEMGDRQPFQDYIKMREGRKESQPL